MSSVTTSVVSLSRLEGRMPDAARAENETGRDEEDRGGDERAFEARGDESVRDEQGCQRRGRAHRCRLDIFSMAAQPSVARRTR